MAVLGVLVASFFLVREARHAVEAIERDAASPRGAGGADATSGS